MHRRGRSCSRCELNRSSKPLSFIVRLRNQTRAPPSGYRKKLLGFLQTEQGSDSSFLSSQISEDEREQGQLLLGGKQKIVWVPDIGF